MFVFAVELDNLISLGKAMDCDLDEMVADMRGACDGLEAEINDISED